MAQGDVRQVRVRNPKTAEVIASALRKQIIRGTVEPGQALPSEAELVKQFGVSRPTLREGLRILESEGLLSIQRGARGGARVLRPSEERAATYLAAYLQFLQTSLSDLYEAISAIEVEAVGFLATHGTETQFAALEELLAEGDEVAADITRFTDAEVRFHRLLVEHAGNKTLAVLRSLLDHIELLTARAIVERNRATVEDLALTKKSQNVHRKLLVHLRAGDVDAATRLWRRHQMAAVPYLQAIEAANTRIDLF